ncbi:hypothetical protein Taro_056948 [Colocasia esculenta]|uniref:Uncharacterized protein n=1 Tax=Colocasia esculenta TaxID=4460 RepID=A0A843XVA0_COLES|nr:hypothetical protein [Colocasia esculenta]
MGFGEFSVKLMWELLVRPALMVVKDMSTDEPLAVDRNLFPETRKPSLCVAVDRPIACCRQEHTELKFQFWKPAPVDSKLVPVDRYKHFYAKDESTHQHRFKGKMCKNVETVSTHVKSVSTRVDTLSEQVDTRSRFQNSQFEELGQQVDTLSEQVDTRPSSQNSQFADSGQQVDTLKSRAIRIFLGMCALVPQKSIFGILRI